MARRRSRWFDLVEYGVARVTLFAIDLLPERPAYAVMAGLGRQFFRCSKMRQGYAMRLLRNAYLGAKTDAELLRIGRIATGNMFKVVLDTVRIRRWIRNGRLEERLDLSAFRAANMQAPFLALSPHVGSWEMAAVASARVWGEAHVLVHVFENPLLQRFLARSREEAGIVLHPKRGGIRAIRQALDAGHLAMQAPDQHQRLRGVWVPFFGELASSERSAAALALRRGLPIVIGGAVRTGPGLRFATWIQEPWRPEPTGDHEADVERVVAEVNRRMEQFILAFPEQYLWIHNRYKKSVRAPQDARA